MAKNMKVIPVEKRTDSLIENLTRVWGESVTFSHLFLSPKEISDIKKCISKAISCVKHLIIAEDEQNHSIAFAGIEDQKLEMLFVAPEYQGKGIGNKLLQFAIENYSVNELTVNEQNPAAIGFYEHLGFKVFKRTDFDEQGRPYPLLYMEKS